MGVEIKAAQSMLQLDDAAAGHLQMEMQVAPC